MRLRKRHAWGAVLVLWFALPVLRPGGVDPVERPVGQALSWLAEVPALNPRLLQGDPVSSVGDAPKELLAARDREVLRLWYDNVVLRERLQQAGALAATLGADRLQQVPALTSARVLRARDPVAWRRSYVLDAGSDAGIERHQPVVYDGVLLGRVEVAWPGASQVQLVTDPQTRLEVFVISSTGQRLRGWTRREGTIDGLDALAIEFVRWKPADGRIEPGAPVVSANQDAQLPSGLLVGRIAEVGDADRDGMPTLRMTPLVDPDRITEVVVLRLPRDPRVDRVASWPR